MRGGNPRSGRFDEECCWVHGKPSPWIRITIKISLHAKILACIGTMNPPLLDRPPWNNSCPAAIPSPLPSDGRGEGQGEVRVPAKAALPILEWRFPTLNLILILILTMNLPLLDRLPWNKSCPSAVPSPLPSDGRGEG